MELSHHQELEYITDQLSIIKEELIEIKAILKQKNKYHLELREKLISLIRTKFPIVYVIQVKTLTGIIDLGCFSTKEHGLYVINNNNQYQIIDKKSADVSEDWILKMNKPISTDLII